MGFIMTNSNNVISEINNRINKSNKCCHGFSNIMTAAVFK